MIFEDRFDSVYVTGFETIEFANSDRTRGHVSILYEYSGYKIANAKAGEDDEDVV